MAESSGTGEPGVKKRKSLSDDVLGSFHVNFKEKASELIDAYNSLFFEGKRCTLIPIILKYCNAEESVTFSESYCKTTKTKIGITFGALFEKGLKILHEYLSMQKIPEGRLQKQALSLLIAYVCNEDEQELMENEWPTEISLTLALMNHFFMKLVPATRYLLDYHYQGKLDRFYCPACSTTCEEHKKGGFADTSIGNKKVWHGCVDAILGGELAVCHAADNPDSPGIHSGIEVKKKFVRVNDSKLIAQTIVFSILQKQKNEENPFVPTIGISNSVVYIYMYNAVNDVLLGTPPLPYTDTNSVTRLRTIIAVWLAANYKLFCSGLMNEDNENMFVEKSNFVELAKEQLEIYKSKLKFAGVGTAGQYEADSDVEEKVFPDLTLKICKSSAL